MTKLLLLQPVLHARRRPNNFRKAVVCDALAALHFDDKPQGCRTNRMCIASVTFGHTPTGCRPQGGHTVNLATVREVVC